MLTPYSSPAPAATSAGIKTTESQCSAAPAATRPGQQREHDEPAPKRRGPPDAGAVEADQREQRRPRGRAAPLGACFPEPRASAGAPQAPRRRLVARTTTSRAAGRPSASGARCPGRVAVVGAGHHRGDDRSRRRMVEHRVAEVGAHDDRPSPAPAPPIATQIARRPDSDWRTPISSQATSWPAVVTIAT